MKNNLKIMLSMLALTLMFSCNDDDETGNLMPETTGNTITYDLGIKDVEGMLGVATFTETTDGEIFIKLLLTGTSADGAYPAHIHFNTAAEGGDIALTLGTIEGGSGFSTITTSTLDDGTAITFNDILNFDGYINIHLNANDLGTIVAQGDIGQNDLTGETIEYDLGEKDVAGISGTATFSERLNGEALAELMIMNTPAGGVHPAHIHENTAAETGGILFSFNPVDGDTGMSMTNVAMDDAGNSLSYADIGNLDAYVNVHLSTADLGTIVSQGDIGQNDLTENTTTYDLGEKAVAGISGDVMFTERVNGEALATIMLFNTPADGVHPAHIHMNTAAESGGILFSFNPVDGDTGISMTNVAMDDAGNALMYADISGLDAYVNVHLSADNLGTIVAQGDIGQNDLTGDSKEYALNEKDVPTISGIATFYKRVDGSALAVLNIMNTPAGGSHPAHIHENDIATGGGISFSFNPVNGDTGMSMTQVEALDNGDAISYDEVLTYNGYINVHFSSADLATIVAQGNIGSNE